MQPLNARELLDVWEIGATQPLAQRALLLLSGACPDASYESLAHLPLGQRDARLAQLREWLFGSTVQSVINCPQCREPMQLTLDTREVYGHAPETPPAENLSLTVDGLILHYRLPDSRDLLAMTNCATAADRQRVLLERCVQIADDGNDQAIGELSANVISAISSDMARADPHADLQFDLHCPACEHQWLAAFDLATFFWSEIEMWAQRMIRQIHALARAYGWSETEILSLSAKRRRMYLDLIEESRE